MYRGAIIINTKHANKMAGPKLDKEKDCQNQINNRKYNIVYHRLDLLGCFFPGFFDCSCHITTFCIGWDTKKSSHSCGPQERCQAFRFHKYFLSVIIFC